MHKIIYLFQQTYFNFLYIALDPSKKDVQQIEMKIGVTIYCIQYS